MTNQYQVLNLQGQPTGEYLQVRENGAFEVLDICGTITLKLFSTEALACEWAEEKAKTYYGDKPAINQNA